MEKERKKLANKLLAAADLADSLTDEMGRSVYDTFRKLPPRTGSADYYKVILYPMSFHSLKAKTKKLTYEKAGDFVRDLVQISWNARYFNERSSIFHKHAVILENFIKSTILPKLKNDKTIPDHNSLEYPDLGPLPEDDSVIPPPVGIKPVITTLNAESFDNDEDYEEEYDEPSLTPQPIHYENRSRIHQYETGIKRGRPPTVDKPFETRLKLILKNFKKLRDPSNPERSISTPFDKLPDKSNTNFYNSVRDPMSLAEIRTKLRQKKYKDVNECLNDLEYFFQTYKNFYERDPYSLIYQDLLQFETEAKKIIEIELAKSDSEVIASSSGPGGDGVVRFPLDEINVHGHNIRVGDWVLINNPINPDKPTVGQVFRLWSTQEGVQYTNVCWYYRPEQTSHRVDRLFYINEVCKTGQYRDHLAAEIVGPCFVLFLTRYQRGDLPHGFLPEGCPWFICEFRYNETSHVFNRIRTWRACLPDEIRDHPEPPVVPLNEARKLIKYESPIKNLLPNGAHENMEIPPVREDPNKTTPPIVGSVYLRPVDTEDDLGQYYTSPNITATPENDDHINNRKAYLFTPVSQSKSLGYPQASQLANYGNSTPTYNATAASFATQPSYQYNPDMYKVSSPFKQKDKRPATPSAPPTTPHSSTSNYSMLLQGGVISYQIEDTNQLGLISDNFKRQKIGDNIVWFRGPPLRVPTKYNNSEGYEIGHSTKYLSWKLRQQSALKTIDTNNGSNSV